MVGVWLVMQQRRGEQETGGAVCVLLVCGTERWSMSFYCSSPLFPPAQTHLSLDLSLARSRGEAQLPSLRTRS